jgi:hypothetical protein
MFRTSTVRTDNIPQVFNENALALQPGISQRTDQHGGYVYRSLAGRLLKTSKIPAIAVLSSWIFLTPEVSLKFRSIAIWWTSEFRHSAHPERWLFLVEQPTAEDVQAVLEVMGPDDAYRVVSGEVRYLQQLAQRLGVPIFSPVLGSYHGTPISQALARGVSLAHICLSLYLDTMTLEGPALAAEKKDTHIQETIRYLARRWDITENVVKDAIEEAKEIARGDPEGAKRLQTFIQGYLRETANTALKDDLTTLLNSHLGKRDLLILTVAAHIRSVVELVMSHPIAQVPAVAPESPQPPRDARIERLSARLRDVLPRRIGYLLEDRLPAWIEASGQGEIALRPALDEFLAMKEVAALLLDAPQKLAAELVAVFRTEGWLSAPAGPAEPLRYPKGGGSGSSEQKKVYEKICELLEHAVPDSGKRQDLARQIMSTQLPPAQLFHDAHVPRDIRQQIMAAHRRYTSSLKNEEGSPSHADAVADAEWRAAARAAQPVNRIFLLNRIMIDVIASDSSDIVMLTNDALLWVKQNLPAKNRLGISAEDVASFVKLLFPVDSNFRLILPTIITDYVKYGTVSEERILTALRLNSSQRTSQFIQAVIRIAGIKTPANKGEVLPFPARPGEHRRTPEKGAA